MSIVTQLSDEEWLVELVRFFGWQKASRLIGFCLLWTIQRRTREEVDSMPEFTTEWRVRTDFKMFRKYLQAAGKWPADDTTGDVELMQRTARAHVA